MKYSIFYRRSPQGDAILEALYALALECPSHDVANQFMAELPLNQDLFGLYKKVWNKGNLHQEMGRQARKAMRAGVKMRGGYPVHIEVDGGYLGSFTWLLPQI